MDEKRGIGEEAQTTQDDAQTDLGGAVRSLSDSELRDLLVALLSEWRDRRGEFGLPN